MQKTRLFFVLASLFVAACAKQAVRPEEPVAAPTPKPAPAPKPAPPPPPQVEVAEATVPLETPVAVKPADAPRPDDPPVVHFDFNSWYLDESARAALAQYADLFRKKKGKITLVIEGHADERGTAEYNLVLGERRASAVRKYLAALGVSGKKLKTISYGENKPASEGHDEQAYALNRRAEMKPTEAKR